MWSGLITVLVIAVASNLDNAGVGIAYGVRNIRFSFWANLMIAIISGICTWVAGYLGDTLTHYVPASIATWIGGIVMIAVGIWVCTEPWRSQWARRRKENKGNVVARILRDPTEADFDNSQTISIQESLVLGIALALNAFAGGFDAGVVHIGVLMTAIVVGLFSFLLLGFSAYIGHRYASRVFGTQATYIAGILLMVIGVHQIW